MKPAFEDLRALCPDVDERLVREHLGRLDDEYFQRFDLQEVARHVQGLSRLSGGHAVELIVTNADENNVDCTVLAFDYPFEFSALSGVLSGMGFSVLSGDIFTYERPGPEPADPPGRARFRDRRKAVDPLRRRRIIDRFSGTFSSTLPFDAWSAELKRRIAEVLGLFEKGDPDSIADAKRRVNEWATERLAEIQAATLPVLYPVQVKVDSSGNAFTRLSVESQDTPAFLYSLSTALSLHGVSIEHVRIRTFHGRVEDEIDFVDAAGQPVTDPATLDRVKLSVLFTKQFTYFLDRAPDPYTALSRFEHLIQDTSDLPDGGRWLDVLSNPRAMQDLARLLGASDYLWEDFIRLQYESLMPILKPHVEGRRFSEPPEALPARLEQTLAGAATYEEKRRRLNEFKDREIFLIDLDHILSPRAGFALLSDRLTVLAETALRAAVGAVYDQLASVHGRPRTVAGLEAPFAMLGLGKMGGAALGYASDIELLFVFSDNGRTDGAKPVGNDEFYAVLARETAQFIEAKREGIFHVDLRLRPYGSAGPLAPSLESFVRYYGPGGPAHSYEKLALVRLRMIGGDPDLGARVERLRDEFIYASPHSIRVKDLQDLRAKQFEEKRRGEEYNAKFSPGALVDLEYAVQILQVLYAKDSTALRTPRVNEALDALQSAGVLKPDESERLVAAYDFLRLLINGLRMLRGSAKDLFLPAVESEEFVHLARRMGYERQGALTPAQQLFVEFETQTAAVRAFVEHHFGRESLPGPAMGNVADLLLSETVPLALRHQILVRAGFADTERAYTNLRRLAGEGARRDVFVKLAVLACDMLRREPDPDMALNNWELFAGTLPDPGAHYRALLSQPKRLELVLAIFSRSQFLANTVIRHPDFMDWVTDPERLHKPLKRDELESELRDRSRAEPDHAEWLKALRRFRQREILKIGTRDMCLRMDTRDIMLDLSTLAEAILQVALERVWADLRAEGRLPPAPTPPADHFCVLAFGKLGGRELNYSSDIDLLSVYDDRGAADDETSSGYENAPFMAAMERLRSDLAGHTEEGHAFRVDLRLRPYGTAGVLVSSIATVEAYYRETASLWEIQALLKLRPVAGNLSLGEALLQRLRPVLLARRNPREIVESIHKMRESAVQAHGQKLAPSTDVKSGLGGIREIEFLAQGLQLMHAAEHPELLTPNTLQALDELDEAGLLPEADAERLAADYIFLRRVEHYLQILEDRQIHTLPTDPAELSALARRMLGADGRTRDFTTQLDACLRQVHQSYLSLLSAKPRKK